MGYVEEYLANEAQNGAGKTVRDQTSTFPGFPRLLESPGFFFFKIPGPGKSWKNILGKCTFFYW